MGRAFEMSDDSGLPPYVHHGDVTDARRTRRSFRFCVAACVLLAGTLWFSERFLRFELTESQYIAALTLRTESSRAVLRSVVLTDSKQHETPTPKYTEALAEREEEDRIIPTYENAVKLDPNNPQLLVRYGCALFQSEMYGEARDCFDKAARLPVKNALPKYLGAASEALKQDSGGDGNDEEKKRQLLTESLALVAKANTGDDPVDFPDPLWSEELPAKGFWYGKLRRQIADECCAPLYKYTDLLFAEARRDIAMRKTQYWDSWLSTIEEMGQRLAAAVDDGAIQMTAGVRIQLDALSLRETVARTGPDKAPDAVLNEFKERKRKLTEALSQIDSFESSRDNRIALAHSSYVLPLRLCGETMAFACGMFLLSWLVGKIFRTDRTMWALPHTRSGVWTLCASSMLLLILLGAMSAVQPFEILWHIPIATVIWRAILLGVFVYGLVYPRMALKRLAAVGTPPAPPVASRMETEGVADSMGEVQAVSNAKETARPDRLWRWKAYVSYWRRYCGVFAGMFFCVVAFWIIGYRLVLGLYPFQIELLVPGLESQEAKIVRDASSLLK
jgi:tetratricopeptide (TPR) repeat protein